MSNEKSLFDTAPAWCKSVTLHELGAAADVIESFLDGVDFASDDEVLAFARALAVQTLCVDDDALSEAMEATTRAMPNVDDIGAEIHQLRTLLNRQESLERGILAAIELLGPSGSPEVRALATNHMMQVRAAREKLVSRETQAGLSRAMKLMKLPRLRRGDV